MTGMVLWNKVCCTNPLYTKREEYNGKVTFSIDAYRQLERATELFGPFGYKWGVKDELFTHADSDKEICIYTAILYYPTGQLPIHADIEIIFKAGSRQGKYNTGWSKKVATNALTKGLSKLGFNADVFQGKFNDQKYVYDMDIKFGNIMSPHAFVTKQMVQEMSDLISKEARVELSSVLQGLNKQFQSNFKSLKELRVAHYTWLKKVIKKYYTK